MNTLIASIRPQEPKRQNKPIRQRETAPSLALSPKW